MGKHRKKQDNEYICEAFFPDGTPVTDYDFTRVPGFLDAAQRLVERYFEQQEAGESNEI